MSPRSREVADHAGTNLVGGAAAARRVGNAPTTQGARLLPLAPLPCRTRKRERERVVGASAQLADGAGSDGWGGWGRGVAAAVASAPRRTE